MACNLWEELGLLYTSGELNEDDRKRYLEHVNKCSDCAGEWENYRSEKKRFFTIDILGETPSAACDAEIIRVCSSGHRKAALLHLFPLFIKKSAVFLTLFLVGFMIVAGYLTLKMNFSAQQNTTVSNAQGSLNSKQQSLTSAEDSIKEPDDSSADSSYEKVVNFADKRGNLNLKGVYPVDLQNK